MTSALTLTGYESQLTNSLIYDNISISFAAGITGLGVNMNIINVTVTENVTVPFVPGPPNAAGVTLLDGTSKISNSIIYGNVLGSDGSNFIFSGSGDDEAVYSHSIIGVDDDCECGPTGTDGGNNLDEDPMFYDVDAKNFSLSACSPAINLGNNDFYVAGGAPDLSSVTKDLVGYRRINQDLVDAGAFEFQSDQSVNVTPLAANGATGYKDVENTAPYDFVTEGDCPLEILTLTPTELSGPITARIWLDSEVKVLNGAAYVQRHFDIEPDDEDGTAQVTLYFTQADFDNFNTHVTEDEYLPTGEEDDEESRKANLRIYQFHGTSSDDSGDPTTYGPSREVIVPTSIVWNEIKERWEVTISVDGFSGFFAGTEALSPLPVRLVNFGGKLNEQKKVQLDWKVIEQENISKYLVEYSGNGKKFTEVGNVIANTATSTQYSFVDHYTHPGALAYYRLKIIEMDGQNAYSRLISVRLPADESMIVYPVPAKNLVWVDWKSSIANSAELTDVNGRVIKIIRRSEATQRIDISGLEPGVYLLKMADGTAMKFVKE